MNVQRSRKQRTVGEIIGIVIVQIYICFLPSSCTRGPSADAKIWTFTSLKQLLGGRADVD